MVKHPEKCYERRKFDDLTPIYPTEKISIRNKFKWIIQCD